jgi:hypothetical protein
MIKQCIQFKLLKLFLFNVDETMPFAIKQQLLWANRHPIGTAR